MNNLVDRGRSTVAGRLVGAGVACTLLVPTWIVMDIVGLPFDVRLITAACLMILYCFLPGGIIRSRLNWIDIGVAGLVISHVISDSWNGEFYFLLPVRAWGEWALPYVAGRYALMHPGNVQRLAPWFVFAACILSLGAIGEAVTGIRLWEAAFLPKDDVVSVGDWKRYDWLYRAWGPFRHPIFLGCVLMLLIPWAVALCGASDRRRWVGATALPLILCGIIGTVSRGPLLCTVLAAFIFWAYYSVIVRRLLMVAAGVGLLLITVYWSAAVDILDRTESHQRRSHVVEVDGQAEVLTGTRSRLFVLEIYGPLVLRGGPWGYGSDATDSFPPNIPGLPPEAKTRQTLGIVDNSYILIGLRFGWLGAASLLLTLGASLAYVFHLAARESPVTYPHGNEFLAALGAILIGICVQIMTVYSSYEFVFWILFTAGVVSGLAVLDSRIRRGEVEFT